MSTPEQPPTAAATVPTAPRGRGGLIALILGIVAIVFAFIPFLSYIAGFIGVAAIIVGAIAIRRAATDPKGAAITGLILGIVSIILAIVMSIIYSTIFFLAAASQSLSSYSGTVPSDAASSLTTPPSAASSTPGADASTTETSRAVTYTVRGSGKAGTISYLTVNGGQAGQEQVTGQSLPWKKVVKIKDDSLFSTSVFSLVAQNGAGSGKITCEIQADGKVISKHTSSGQYAVVTCSGQADQ